MILLVVFTSNQYREGNYQLMSAEGLRDFPTFRDAKRNFTPVKLNPGKSEVILSRKGDPLNIPLKKLFPPSIEEIQLSFIKTVQSLGALFDSLLTVDEQVASVSRNAFFPLQLAGKITFPRMSILLQ